MGPATCFKKQIKTDGRRMNMLPVNHVKFHVVFAFIGAKNELKSRKENPQKLTQASSRSHHRHLRGKKDSTKRHHHRHHKRQPGEQQFPIEVVTG